MATTTRGNKFLGLIGGIMLALLAGGCMTQAGIVETESAAMLSPASSINISSYIVQASSAAAAAAAVESVGGRVTHQLAVIRAVGAELDDA